MVFCGLVTAWRLAGAPTRRSPLGVKATTEGVVRLPSRFGITTGCPPSITETTELVVPRSIPMIFDFDMTASLSADRDHEPPRHEAGRHETEARPADYKPRAGDARRSAGVNLRKRRELRREDRVRPRSKWQTRKTRRPPI